MRWLPDHSTTDTEAIAQRPVVAFAKNYCNLEGVFVVLKKELCMIIVLHFDSGKSFIQMYRRIMFLFGLTNALQCYKCGPDGDKVAHHKMAK